MGGFFASFAAWIFSKATGDFLKKFIAALAKTDDGAIRLEEIKAELEATKIEAAVTRQVAKMNWPIFWVIIAIMMGPPALMLWAVGVYNILWWEHGIWPQTWSIADFPPSIKPWIEASITWLYDPLGPPLGVGTALVAGTVTRRR